MKANKFLILVCLFFFTLTLPVVLVNVYINSYGYYGDYQLGEAPIFNAHIAKYHYLKQEKFKPEAIVLGSSNSMRMLPETIDSLFGLKAFNYGVYQASIEDFWCISHTCIEDLKIKPKLIIICVDDWNFKSYTGAKDIVFKGAQNRLSYKPVFSKYLHDFYNPTLIWSKVKTAISFEQFKTSYPFFINIIKGDTSKKIILPLSNAFFNNGVRKHYADEEGRNVVEIAENEQYKLTDYLKEKHLQALKRSPKGLIKGTNEDFEKFQKERFELFDELISYLQKNDINVIINIMPINKYYQELLFKTSNYKERISQVNAFMINIKKKYSNVLLVKDNHLIESFGGKTDNFFDQIHPTSVTSNQMLYSIKKELGNYAF